VSVLDADKTKIQTLSSIDKLKLKPKVDGSIQNPKMERIIEKLNRRLRVQSKDQTLILELKINKKIIFIK
jgi:hypothetical protein